jgi:hypothetical protein
LSQGGWNANQIERWVAFGSNESAQSEVYVESLAIDARPAL